MLKTSSKLTEGEKEELEDWQHFCRQPLAEMSQRLH